MAKSIVYVGHSRGTSLIFMYASEFPEEAAQLLHGFVALAPIVYFDPHEYVKIALTLAPALGVSFIAYLLKIITQNVENPRKT